MRQASTPEPLVVQRSAPAVQTGGRTPQAGAPPVVVHGKPASQRVSESHAEPASLHTSTVAPLAPQRSVPAAQTGGAAGQKASPSASTSQARPEAHVWLATHALPVALQTSTAAPVALQRVRPAVQMGGAMHAATPSTLPQVSAAPQVAYRPVGLPAASHDQTSHVGP
jgi:hypothetical protein